MANYWSHQWWYELTESGVESRWSSNLIVMDCLVQLVTNILRSLHDFGRLRWLASPRFISEAFQNMAMRLCRFLQHLPLASSSKWCQEHCRGKKRKLPLIDSVLGSEEMKQQKIRNVAQIFYFNPIRIIIIPFANLIGCVTLYNVHRNTIISDKTIICGNTIICITDMNDHRYYSWKYIFEYLYVLSKI